MYAELAKAYAPSEVEDRWAKKWVREGLFVADAAAEGPAFSMVIPPPNVTGHLHLGHALNNTIQDVLLRYKKMDGFNTLWVPGTDHASIATQNVVERQLAEKGTDRHTIGRDAFLDRTFAWKNEVAPYIISQLQRLGASCDWTRERFTMDEGLSRAVREVFVRLYEEGLLYRGERLINWCCRCGTALSDIEVEHRDAEGNLWHFRYPLADGFARCIIYGVRIIVGDVNARHGVSGRAHVIARHRRGLRLANGDAIGIVFDHAYERKPPNAGEIKRFVERALVRRALADKGDSDMGRVSHLEREGGAHGRSEAFADNAVGGEIDLGIEQMHVAAAPSAQSA